MQVQCIKCKKKGTLSKNQYRRGDRKYEYYCIQHVIAGKRTWCYIGKTLPDEYKMRLIQKESLSTTYTQPTTTQEKPNSNVFHENHAKLKWTGWDLNPRPPECKSGIHTAELPAQRRN